MSLLNAESDRAVVDVAVGILLRRDGQGLFREFLLTSRPTGKVFADYWEFPGGKLEAGESVAQALVRELQEEIGVTVTQVEPWREDVMDYPHARVRLHFCKVTAWEGRLQMREGQAMCWQTLPVVQGPLLPGSFPVIRWLAAEWGHAGPLHV